VSRLLFAPISVVSGLLAGAVGKKIFARVWSLFDNEDAPDPKHRDVTWPKVILALLLEGAVFRAVRGVVDRGAREAFSKLTGVWPGEDRPKQRREQPV
jgi:hypothetical protein